MRSSPGSSTAKKTAPFGSWSSPVDTDLIVSDSVRLAQPCIDNGLIYWSETRPTEKGRTVLVRHNADGSTTDLTPAPYSVRSRVHEYGGGAALVCKNRIWFVNDSDQDIYEATDTGVTRLTNSDNMRFANMVFDEQHNRLLAVCEDHGASSDPVNSLVAIDLSCGEIDLFTDGADFYSNPCMNSDASQIAWLQWNHPNLPWDCTELWLADVDSHGTAINARLVSQGHDESVFQPSFGPDDRLYFVSDRNNWWNLYRHNGQNDDDDTVEAVTQENAEFGMPQWVFSMSTYAFVSTNNAVCAYTKDGRWHVAMLDLNSKTLTTLDLPWTGVDHLAADARQAVILAGSPDSMLSIIRLDLSDSSNAGDSEILCVCNPAGIPDGYVSIPQSITYPSGGGSQAHGMFYPPVSATFCGPEREAPPLLVFCHGGPTASAPQCLKLTTQFWTSRGFAVLDVNYRGSTGFGRSYRRELYGNWGIADVEDCISGARWLAERGLVDKEKWLISGGSAGGFTVLSALTFHDSFKVGASHYGIADLSAMFATTHKFEASYDYWLLGNQLPLEELCAQRSPIRHADRLNCPVIFFQGLDDKVVPPAQSEMMVNVLRKKGVPVSYLAFENEAHGFRQADTIRRVYDAELYFFEKMLGFEPSADIEPVHIDNFD